MSMRPLLASALLAGSLCAQLPPVPEPSQNPRTPEKTVLGKILFWDEQLSSDDSVACGTCHLPEFGGTHPELANWRHPGLDRQFGTEDDVRSSPGVVRQDQHGDFRPDPLFGLRRQVANRVPGTVHGAAYHDNLFWDLRASTQFVDPETQQVVIPYDGALESQAVGPIMNPVEMATEGRTWQQVRQKLQAARPLALASALPPDVAAALQQNPTYPLLFAAAFGDPAITARRIAFAIASYERTLIPDDTPWDRFMAGQTAALSAIEQQGWALYQTSGRCRNCHTEPLFQDDVSHVLGLRPKAEDRGVFLTTQVVTDDGAFKTPGLRNAGLRPRLFHNGQSPPLGDPTQVTDPASVFSIYWKGGGVDRENLDGYLVPLQFHNVSVADLLAILEFVRTGLTDPRAALALPPFDHPRLRSAVATPPLVYGQGLPGAIEPFLVDTVPTFLGNAAWKLGLAAGDGPTLGYLGYGARALPPGVVYGGLPWNVEVLDGRLFALGGAPGAPGHATWRLPIPNDPNLRNLELFFQLWAFDALAPAGVATSRGSRFVLQ